MCIKNNEEIQEQDEEEQEGSFVFSHHPDSKPAWREEKLELMYKLEC